MLRLCCVVQQGHRYGGFISPATMRQFWRACRGLFWKTFTPCGKRFSDATSPRLRVLCHGCGDCETQPFAGGEDVQIAWNQVHGENYEWKIECARDESNGLRAGQKYSLRLGLNFLRVLLHYPPRKPLASTKKVFLPNLLSVPVQEQLPPYHPRDAPTREPCFNPGRIVCLNPIQGV